MSGELSWLHVDRLASHYGAAVAHVGRLESLATELSQVCDSLEHRQPSMTDLSLFLSPRADLTTETVRATAWISQHVLQCRAWCVGQKIIESPKSARPHSPLLKQLQMLGVRPHAVDLKALSASWRNISKHDKLDVLLFTPASDTVYLVKGQSSSAARNLGSKLTVIPPRSRKTLFGDDKAFLRDVNAKTESFAALCFARQLVQEALAGLLNVRALFVTVEDLGGSGRFQFHEVISAKNRSFDGNRTQLDDFPVVATHEDFASMIDKDPEALLGLPDWPESDFLHKAPVDLPIRTVMILKTIADQQRSTGKRLWLRSPREIAELVRREYMIHYPKNMSRHDVDRLQRIGLLEWAPDGSARIGLTAAGIARAEILNHRFNPMIPRNPARMLEAIKMQEEHWVAASRI